MISSDRAWFKFPGASVEALQDLRASVGIALPQEYFDLLAFSNGGEGPLPVFPYNFCLDPVAEATQAWINGVYKEFFPGFFVFGGSGGGEFIAFDLREKPPWPVVAIDMTNIELSESVDPIASDFTAFLALIGLERTVGDSSASV